MDLIQSNLQDIYARISAASAARQPVCLIAVSKTQPPECVAAAAQAGQRDFGENYIQEGVDKIEALKPRHPSLVWHMIGPIQSNKTRLVAEHFDWVHTLDRLKTAQRLSEQRPAQLPPLQVLIQVNVDREVSKSGVLPEQVLPLAQQIVALPRLRLRGLMCIPEHASQTAFASLAALLAQLNGLPEFEGKIEGKNSLEVLSMGMSGDFEAAIALGATHVRVGSAIFGARL